VVVADIEGETASSVAAEARVLGARALATTTDVSDYAAVRRLADDSYDEFGRVDVLCNNAGVLLFGETTTTTPEDWQWVLSVNVMGVVHGIQAFVPRMVGQGAGHIVNTVSVASLGGAKGSAVYSASKNAVLAISETLREELVEHGIGVTALCPASIASRILDAQRNRPPSYGRRAAEPYGTDVSFGIDPMHVARRAVQAIRDNDLYVFVLPEVWSRRVRARADERCAQLSAAIDAGEVPAKA
jgi:NAD(P)-dependent dehydrogenase (short-subunit alcohol dehydrogenase family)